MKAIGLDHRTKDLIGFRHITMVNGSLWVTGMEIAAVLSTITTGITTETVTSTIMADMVITATTGTIDS